MWLQDIGEDSKIARIRFVLLQCLEFTNKIGQQCLLRYAISENGGLKEAYQADSALPYSFAS